MQNKTKTHLVFWGKSLVWSVLLYAALMLLLNWDDITSTPKINSASYTTSIDSTSTTKIQSGGASLITLLSYIYCNIVRNI